jgi:hypothetical protein
MILLPTESKSIYIELNFTYKEQVPCLQPLPNSVAKDR